jgi:hypothetical protein
MAAQDTEEGVLSELIVGRVSAASAEYSAEEEIILNDATYAPRVWPVTDPRAADEWNLSHIPAAMM